MQSAVAWPLCQGGFLVEISFNWKRLAPMSCNAHFTPSPIGERSIVISVSVCVCLSAIVPSELHVRFSPIFLCTLPVTRSSSGDVLCYVFPVL